MKKMNKKGFTLIELLAVIVVLAVIMILALPNILDIMNGATKKSFQMYGEKLIKDAMTLYESQYLLGDKPAKKYSGNYCYTFDDLKISDGGMYEGFVVVTVSAGNTVAYNLYLTDGVYAYNGTSSEEVINDIEKVSTTQTDIDAVPTEVAKCKS